MTCFATLLSFRRSCDHCGAGVEGDGHAIPGGVILCRRCCPCGTHETFAVAEWNGRRFQIERIDEYGAVIIAPGTASS